MLPFQILKFSLQSLDRFLEKLSLSQNSFPFPPSNLDGAFAIRGRDVPTNKNTPSPSSGLKKKEK
jgi:hypothetical protein